MYISNFTFFPEIKPLIINCPLSGNGIIIHLEVTFSSLPLLLFASCSDAAVRYYHRFSINPVHSTVKFYFKSDHLLLLVLLPSVVGRIMTTKDVYVVIPGIF